jgi:PAS domain S-box-containing protein
MTPDPSEPSRPTPPRAEGPAGAGLGPLAEWLPEPFWSAGPDGRVDLANAAARAALGADPVGRDWLDALAPDDAARARRAWDAARAGGADAIEGAYALRGEPRPRRLRLGALRDASGRVARLVARAEADAADDEPAGAARLLRSIADNASTALFVLDAEGRITFMNPAAEAMTGFAFAEARGAVLHELIHHSRPDGTPLPMAECPIGRRVLAGHPLRDHDDVFHRKDGSTFPVRCAARPIVEAGAVVGMVFEVRDITEERRAESALRESEARLRRIVDSNAVGVVVADLSGRVIDANAAFLDLVGYTPEDVRAGRLDFHALTPPEFRPRDEGAIAAMRATGRHAPFEKEYLHRDGRRVPILVGTAYLGRDADGRELGVGLVIDLTERRRAEEALRASESRFRALMDQAPFSVQLLDADGRTLHVNRAWEDLWGVTVDQVADYNMLEDAQLAAKGVLPHLRRAFAGEPADLPAIQYDPNESIPDRTRHADPRRWVAAVAYPLKDPDGAVREVVLVHDDITERRRVEDDLRASEARFRHLADAMPQIVWITGPGRDVEYVNRRWLDYTGQDVAQALGPDGWRAAVHPDDVGAIVDASLRSHAEGTPFEAEYRIRDAHGGYRWHLGRAVAIRDDAGRVVRRFGTATDIDDRRRAEQDARFLAEAGATLAALVDESSTLQRVARLAVPAFADWCSVDLIGPDGHPECLAVAHVDPQKVALAHDLRRRYPPDPDAPHGLTHVIRTGRAELVAEIPDALLVAGARDADHLRILRDLGLRSYICVPLASPGGTIGALSFVAAESGRRYGPEDLRLAEDLAHRAGVAIENARLYAALQEADRRKDEFLAMLAHELRNPLAPIRHAVAMMALDEGDPAARRDSRAVIDRQARHLTSLVDDLLDVSRINEGKITLARRPLAVSAFVQAAVEAARPLIDARRHALSVRMPAEPLSVEGDLTRLTQVALNLLNNAAKYTPEGGRIRLTVAAEGASVVVRVADDGEGIAPELLPRVFDLFTQASRSLDRAQGGLGVGLTLVRRLVEMHGGAVEAQSAGPGRGSTFTVRLPRLSDSVAAVAPAPPRAAPAVAAAPEAPRRILLVDDSRDAADTLARLLRRFGHAVEVAYDGPAALAAARRSRPEVVLLDIGLPGLDGYEVARRLRRDPALAGVQLVALSGYGTESDRRRGAEAGFDAHLVKPVDLPALRRLLAADPRAGRSPEGGAALERSS